MSYYEIRAYQEDLLAEADSAFRNGFRSVLLQLATGGGKTVVAGELTRRLYAQAAMRAYQGVIALYVVHRKELIRQTKKTLTNFGMGGQIGIIQGDEPMSPNAPLQISSIQTLVRRMRNLPWLRPIVIIFDEAHHIRANSWEEAVNYYQKAFRLGLTATPARLDDKGLGKHFEHMILGPSIPELVEWGSLAPIETYTIPLGVDLRKLRRGAAGEYTRASLEQVIPRGPMIASTVRNFEKLAWDRRVLNFSYSIETSKDTVARLRGMGIRAEHVDGETPGILRDQIFDRFERGETQFLSNVGLVTEGFDCPECDCVMLSRLTASVVFYKQMVGRVMRPKADGRPGRVIDLGGNIDRHGDPDAEIEWNLADGVVEESARKARTSGRSCKNCGFRFKGDECPACGQEWRGKVADEVDVDLEQRGSKKDKKTKMTPGQRMERTTAILATGGDLTAMKRLAASLGMNTRIAYVWKDIPAYRMAWAAQAKRDEEMERFNEAQSSMF